MSVSAARELVCDRIALQARRFPDLDFAPLEIGDLSAPGGPGRRGPGRDAALARAIDLAVIQRWLTLVAVLDAVVDQPWERLQGPVQAALLVGAAQLLLFERLPDHAVINEAVQWMKGRAPGSRRRCGGRAQAGGLVNAVLRKVARMRGAMIDASSVLPREPLARGCRDRDVLPLHDGRAWRLTEPAFAEDPARRLAQQTSHGQALIDHWIAEHGWEQALRLAEHSLVHPPILVAGAQHDGRGATAVPAFAGMTAPVRETVCMPHAEPGFVVYTGPREGLKEFLEEHPDARVQDPGAAQAVAMTAGLDPPPRTIVDLCAGKGTKTRQLTALHPQAQIIATDIQEARLEALRESSAALPQVRVLPLHEVLAMREVADLLVLDVPCSNTGVLARRPEAKYRFSSESLPSVVNVQRQIIADGIPLLRPEGMILYSTCSIEAAENQKQWAWVARWHGRKVIEHAVCFPAGRPGDPAAEYRDGGGYALLR